MAAGLAMTPKQQRFVEEYLIDLNAKQAAIRAGYSKKTARSVGAENLTKPDIAKAIAKAQDARSERTEIDADWVLRELAAIKQTSVADFLVTPEGGGRPYFDLSAATPEQLAAIEGVQLDADKVKITLPGKLKTLELIGKHVNVQAFADRKEIGGIGGGPVKVEGAMDALEQVKIIHAAFMTVKRIKKELAKEALVEPK